MEVTRKNFNEAIPLVEQSVQRADFLVIDTEFTGLISGRDVSAFDSPQEYYKRIIEGASDFLLIQFGLVAFYQDKVTGEYVNDAYNFYLFPKVRPGPERVFQCQSSSIDFLASQGFDFNKLFREGIPYLSQPAETTLRERLQERQKAYSNGIESIIPIPDENRAQIEEISVKDFLEATEPEELEIDRVNAFIRKLVFQEVATRFKDKAYFETKVLENKNRVVRVTRLSSSDDSKSKQDLKREKEWEEVEQAVGFSRVARMISESEKLTIGHNMLLDVLHTLNHFFQPLSDDYPGFKEFAHCMFPRILDTKYMSSLPPFKDKVTSSALPHLLATLSEEPFSVPECKSEEGRGYCRTKDKSHEAGFDAYITGLCFLAMYRHLARMRGETADQKVSEDSAILKPFLNKLYLAKTAHYDSPYINLDGGDPEPSRNNVFYVTFQKEWTRNDIVQLFSPFGPVNIQFVDDVSALVWLARRELAHQAARTLMRQPSKICSVTTYAKYKMDQARGLGHSADAAHSHWLSKERLEEYKKRIQVIASKQPAPAESSSQTAPVDDDVSSTTSNNFVPLRVERTRTRTSSASSADASPLRGGRKRTSSGVFQVADAEPPPRPEPPRSAPKRAANRKVDAKLAPPARESRDESAHRQRKPSVATSDNSDSQVSPKKSKKETFGSAAPAQRVAAFEESDNWD